MKTQKLALTLTGINLLILLSLLLTAFTRDVAPVVRGRAFELIDKDGKVRAEIKIAPAEPTLKMPNGTVGYPETVLLRLIDSNGGPNVKIAATEDGSGLVLGGESGYVQILSRTAEPIVKLADKKGNEQVWKIK